jgi:hypothetical protein
VLGALGVVGAGVGGLVLVGPSLVTARGVPAGADTTMTIQQRSAGQAQQLAGRGPRFVPVLQPSLPALYQGGR